jgi:hypothetical protein
MTIAVTQKNKDRKLSLRRELADQGGRAAHLLDERSIIERKCGGR